MEIVNEQVNDDGSVDVVVTGDIDSLPVFTAPQAGHVQLAVRCAGHVWAVIGCSKPDPEGGLPVARLCLRGTSRPRRGMVLRSDAARLTVGEVKSFVEAITHFYRIVRSIDGGRIVNLIQEYRSVHPEQSNDSVMLAFLTLATCAQLTNGSLVPTIEPAMADWETVATKINSLL